MKLVIPEELAGKRLDHTLAILTSRSRSSVQNDIEGGYVIVNGKKAKKNLIVTSGDEIQIQERIGVHDRSASDPQIIEDTSEYAVINKPSGMAVHKAERITGRTVVDYILEQYPSAAHVGEDPLRPGIVHRLDKDASGVMVVAKNQESFDSLKRQFKLRQVSKEYLILVYGVVTPQEGKIVLPIARSARHSTRFVGNTTGNRDAITNYVVEKIIDGHSLVRVWPETGRTHQIRVHFYSRGYPLVGDRVYTSKKISQKSRRSLSEGRRLMLHATSLQFHDLSGDEKTYICPPGRDFMEVLERLDPITNS
ncbi:RluA family pseudouridine synthase [Candidatus Uhrbacteria bacterium]|nr:RluA family pseudouridine synthase [Candidatus Uhrbacteria bacterium]